MGAAIMQFTCKGCANGINSGMISAAEFARNIPDFEKFQAALSWSGV